MSQIIRAWLTLRFANLTKSILLNPCPLNRELVEIRNALFIDGVSTRKINKHIFKLWFDGLGKQSKGIYDLVLLRDSYIEDGLPFELAERFAQSELLEYFQLRDALIIDGFTIAKAEKRARRIVELEEPEPKPFLEEPDAYSSLSKRGAITAS